MVPRPLYHRAEWFVRTYPSRNTKISHEEHSSHHASSMSVGKTKVTLLLKGNGKFSTFGHNLVFAQSCFLLHHWFWLKGQTLEKNKKYKK